MKIIIKKILDSIKCFFSRIIDREAKRVNEFNSRMFGAVSDEGGEA